VAKIFQYEIHSKNCLRDRSRFLIGAIKSLHGALEERPFRAASRRKRGAGLAPAEIWFERQTTNAMLKHFSTIALVLASYSSLYAQNPFVGKWKIDEASSHIAGTSDSVTATGPNAWKFQYGAFSWTVKADGTDQPTAFGNTASLKVVNPSTWEFINKSNGITISTETWALAADGKSMTRTFTSKDEGGKPTSGVSTMKRTAGTSGFEGTWESTKVELPFTEIDIAANGDDGVTLHVPADGTHYSLKFDGKEYPEEGPRLPSGMTVSGVKTGALSVKIHTKQNGNTFDTEDWEISADGLTFTYKEQDEGVDKPVVVVLRRIDAH
jgi:hypothetical protein